MRCRTWSLSASGSRSLKSTNLPSLMAWTKFGGIDGRPKLGKRKSTLYSVEPSKDELDGVGTSDRAATATGVDGVAEGTVGVSPAVAEGVPEASQFETGAYTPDRVPVSPERYEQRAKGDLVKQVLYPGGS